jgi:bacteriorhodopsin
MVSATAANVKEDDRVINDVPLRDSFIICQVLFFGLTLVTVIEALRTPSAMARGMMNMESAVSLIAGYVYSMFSKMAENPNTTYADITRLRYYDWFCTTPLLLLTLVMFFAYQSGVPVIFSRYALLFVFNFLMLLSGYMGETGMIDRNVGGAIGFVFFGLLVATLMYGFVIGSQIDGLEKVILGVFLVVWSSYGVVYYIKDLGLRNRIMNVLDVIAKIFIGIMLWAHVSGIMDWK